MCRGREARVAAAPASASGDHNPLIWTGEVVNQFATLAVIKNGADWDLQNYVFRVSSGPVRAFAVSAASRFVFGIESEMNQSIVTFAGFHDHVTTTAAIPARRTTTRDKLFAAKGNDAVPAIAGFYADSCLIYEHGRSFDFKAVLCFSANLLCAVSRPSCR